MTPLEENYAKEEEIHCLQREKLFFPFLLVPKHELCTQTRPAKSRQPSQMAFCVPSIVVH